MRNIKQKLNQILKEYYPVPLTAEQKAEQKAARARNVLTLKQNYPFKVYRQKTPEDGKGGMILTCIASEFIVEETYNQIVQPPRIEVRWRGVLDQPAPAVGETIWIRADEMLIPYNQPKRIDPTLCHERHGVYMDYYILYIPLYKGTIVTPPKGDKLSTIEEGGHDKDSRKKRPRELTGQAARDHNKEKQRRAQERRDKRGY